LLPSVLDEEKALPNTNGYVDSSGEVAAVNEKQDSLVDNDTKQNEEKGIVRRISLEP